MKSLAMFLAVAIGAVAGIAANGDANLARVTTPGVTPIATETPALVPSPATETKTQITSVSGTVSAYEAGRTITLLRPNATTVTYTIDSRSAVPADLATGRKVVIRSVTRPGATQAIVRKVTYSKTKKTTVE